MPALYVIEPGARLEKDHNQLLVTKEDLVIIRVPIQRVSQVMLVGNIGLTTPAMLILLQNEIPVFLLGQNGKLLGRLLPAGGPNLPLRQQQYRRNDDQTFCLELTKAIVISKLHNQRTLALRLARRHSKLSTTGLEGLTQAIHQAGQASDLDSLRGHEGYGASCYFHLFSQAFAPEWNFQTRNRRPPKDPVNALLSLGYTFLSYGIMAALESVGLDPYLGYFHAEKYGRPALALDLMEEFRAPVVDSLVLSLLNQKILSSDHFETDPETSGIRLTAAGWRVFLHKYSNKLESQIQVRSLGRAISYRKLFEVHARHLVHLIQGEIAVYQPFRAR